MAQISNWVIIYTWYFLLGCVLLSSVFCGRMSKDFFSSAFQTFSPALFCLITLRSSLWPHYFWGHSFKSFHLVKAVWRCHSLQQKHVRAGCPGLSSWDPRCGHPPHAPASFLVLFLHCKTHKIQAGDTRVPSTLVTWGHSAVHWRLPEIIHLSLSSLHAHDWNLLG